MISSASIGIPLIIGIVRAKKITSRYYPIIILLGIGALNECITYIDVARNNMPNTNIYALLEFPLYCWQFARWNKEEIKKPLYLTCIGISVALWSIESFYFKNFETKQLNTIYILAYNLCLILFATNTLNRLIVTKRKSILRHPTGIICLAILLFFGFNICVETFYHFAAENPGVGTISNTIQRNVYLFTSAINICFNFMVAIALLWIPRKPDFSPLLH